MSRTGYDPGRRMLYLVAFLQGGPTSRSAIYDAVYDTSSPEKAFQRDRDHLAEIGYQIEEKNGYFYLQEELVDVGLTHADMSLLAVAASTYVGHKSDHRTVRSTLRKLLAGGEWNESLTVRVAGENLSLLLDLATAISTRSPVKIVYTPAKSGTSTYVAEIQSIWSSLGQYYVKARRTVIEGMEIEPDVRHLKVRRIRSMEILSPTGYEITDGDHSSGFAPFDRSTITIEADPSVLPHIAERARVEGNVMTLSTGFVEGLDLLSEIGVEGRTDNVEYLSRLRHVAEL